MQALYQPWHYGGYVPCHYDVLIPDHDVRMPDHAPARVEMEY